MFPIESLPADFSHPRRIIFRQNLSTVLFKRLKLQGMIVGDYDHKYLDKFYEVVPPLIRDGKIKYTESIVHSLDDAGNLILDVQKGNNTGKVSACEPRPAWENSHTRIGCDRSGGRVKSGLLYKSWRVRGINKCSAAMNRIEAPIS